MREQTSLPPASPHRVGHYFGLHPEDQPYQSHKIAIQRLPTQDLERQPEQILLPSVEPEADPEENRQTFLSARYDELPFAVEPPLYMPRKRLLPQNAIPIILIISCIFFLLASSILAFVLISRPSSSSVPVVTASPAVLRVNDTFTLTGHGFGAHVLINFTYDSNKTLFDGNKHALQAHTNNLGAFSIQIQVPGTWEPGQHSIHVTDEAGKLSVSAPLTIQAPSIAPASLQLSATHLSFAADAPGAVSNNTISLINTGGGQITWQQSSDQPWLTASASSNTFSGRESVQITVNRGSLAPGSYSGHIMFTPQESPTTPAQTLTVTMAVKATAAAILTLSPSALAYSASTAQNPGNQTIVLQNSGTQSVDWTSSITTGDGATWLSISPATGHLPAQQSAVVTVSVTSQQLAVGSYQGSIAFSGGAQVNVSLTVAASGGLVISPPALSFTMVVGQQPVYKAIILQNSSSQALNWTASTATANHGSWLSPDPPAGSLASTAEGFMNAKVNVAGLQPGSYQGTLTLASGGAPQQVAISLTVTAPAVGLVPTALNFSTASGSQSLTLTNTGNAPLNWSSSVDSNSTSMITVAPTSGKLPIGQAVNLVISVNIANSAIQAATVTVADSDTGSPVHSQQVAVNFLADIALGTGGLFFSHSATVTHATRQLTFYNDGVRDLHWTVASQPASAASWISFNETAGTIVPGGSKTIIVTCNSAGLPSDTYYASLIISDSDSGTLVISQSIGATLVVV